MYFETFDQNHFNIYIITRSVKLEFLIFVSKHMPVHTILVLITSSRNKGLGKSAHMPRLAWAFAARIHKVWV